MKLPMLPKIKMPMKLSGFYNQHESTILTAVSIGCSSAAITLTLKNARAIIGTLDIAKEMIASTQDRDAQTKIYLTTLKALTPLLGPVLALEVLSALSTIKLKQTTDKKIATLTEALAVANNAIAAYKVFQKEAEKQLTEGQLEEVKRNVVEKQVAENPQTVDNSVVSGYANGCYKYYDPANKRYFYSVVSPSEFKMRIHQLSIAFTKGEINNYDDMGACKVTHNDIWGLIDENLKTEAGKVYGWIDEDVYRGTDEDAIDVDIYPGVDPMEPNGVVWYVEMAGGPLFRTRY